MDQPREAFRRESYDPPRTPPGKTGASLPKKAADFVAAHSSGALVLIIILIVAIFVLFARQKGWFGLGGPRSPMRGRSAKSKSKSKSGEGKARDAEDLASDAETDRLIDSINKAA
jgi:hypothetical protein